MLNIKENWYFPDFIIQIDKFLFDSKIVKIVDRELRSGGPRNSKVVEDFSGI